MAPAAGPGARAGGPAAPASGSAEGTHPDLFEDREIASLRSRAHAYLALGIPVHFRGRAGMGKTTLAMRVAHEIGRPVTVVTGDHALASADLLGREVGHETRRLRDRYVQSVLRSEEQSRALWVDGVLLTAMAGGHTLVYDEFTRSPPETNNVLLAALEERVVHVTSPLREERVVRAHPEFRAIFTSNPDEYTGVRAAPDALFDRMVSVDVSLCGPETEAGIVAFRTGVAPGQARVIVGLLRAVREAIPGGNPPSIRTAIMIGRIVAALGIESAGRDERFVQICLDVLESRCPNGPDPDAHGTCLERVRAEILRASRTPAPGTETAP